MIQTENTAIVLRHVNYRDNDRMVTLLSPSRELPVDQTAGRVFADAQVGCPPCIPIIMSGERIDQNAIECFRYYGIEKVRVTA